MHPYIGSGPYCYSNSLAMMLGHHAPSPSVIEVLTGSPFGFELLAGHLPLFDPYGWDPDQGLDAAIDLLGWTCLREGAEDENEAIGKLRDAVKAGPALVGPVEMGLLHNHPGFNEPIGADHFLLALDVDEERVRYHDPHGFPYATLPVAGFLAAWRADTIGYKATCYTIRSSFQRVRQVPEESALLACLPNAAAWLRQRRDVEVPPGTIGGQNATDRLAGMILAGLEPGIHGHLVNFAIRVGARRLTDAATALARVGLHEAADVADRQARLVGSLQYELVAGSAGRAAETVRTLGPTYATLAALLNPPDPQ
jgi:hypothetical protein